MFLIYLRQHIVSTVVALKTSIKLGFPALTAHNIVKLVCRYLPTFHIFPRLRPTSSSTGRGGASRYSITRGRAYNGARLIQNVM